jgi:mannose-1-phosphate guanylyltransferase
MDKHLYVVIMAGGHGERLWPLSREQLPKPFLKLFAGQSLLERAVARARQLAPPERIFIITHKDLVRLAHEQSQLPLTQIVGEPVGRNTAACIGLGALLVQHRDPQAVMVVLPADHYIEQEEQLVELLRHAGELAYTQDRLVTLGIMPTYPATGFGYIELDRSQTVQSWGAVTAYSARSFTEKPRLEKAQEFLQRGCYLWNSGIFVWKASVILKEIQRCLPALEEGLAHLRPWLYTAQFEQRLSEMYSTLESISIDYGVMQRASHVAVIPAEGLGWNDVGDWNSVRELFSQDEHGNVCVGGSPLLRQTRRSLFFSSHPHKTIAALGVDDVIVVDTPQALLVAHSSRAQQVRELAQQAHSDVKPFESLQGRDPSGMRERLQAFPQQCAEAIAIGRSVSLQGEDKRWDKIVVLGMGGSGVGGELLQRCLKLLVYPAHGDTLPGFVDSQTLLIAVSYSGDTAETLSALQQGLATGATALCVTSGGRLRKVAHEHGFALIEVPSGLPPRAALGYLFLSPLAALERLSVAHVGALDEIPAILQGLAQRWGFEIPTEKNLAKQIALKLHQKVPVIYGLYGLTDVVAQRWKTQINENAKQPAFWNALPELSHNEIEGFVLQSSLLPQAVFVLLRSQLESEQDRRRFKALQALLNEHGLEHLEVWAEGEGQLAHMLSLIYLGDWVSFYLAMLNEIDPWPVPRIAAFKAKVNS